MNQYTEQFQNTETISIERERGFQGEYRYRHVASDGEYASEVSFETHIEAVQAFAAIWPSNSVWNGRAGDEPDTWIIDL